MMDRTSSGRTSARLAVVALLLSVPAACGVLEEDDLSDPGAATTTTRTAAASPAPSSTAVPTRHEQALASKFPSVESFTLVEMDDKEWEKAFKVVNKDLRDELSGGAGRHGFTLDQQQAFDLIVVSPQKAYASSKLMKAEMARLYALAEKNGLEPKITRIGGHDMLEFVDAAHHTNWYWISGEEYVVVAALDRRAGLKFLDEWAPLVV